METYTWLRTFADSWHLLFMFAVLHRRHHLGLPPRQPQGA
jgi:hypothetical protein